MNKQSEYLEPIHIFAFAHVLRRPIIVYGKKHIGGARAQQHPDATPRAHEEESKEEKKAGGSSSAAAAAAAAGDAACQLNHMVREAAGSNATVTARVAHAHFALLPFCRSASTSRLCGTGSIV